MIRQDLQSIYNQFQEIQSFVQHFTFLQDYCSKLKTSIKRCKQLLADQQSQSIKAEQPPQQQQVIPQQKKNKTVNCKPKNENASKNKKEQIKLKQQKKQLNLQNKTIGTVQQPKHNQGKPYESPEQQLIQKVSIEHIIEQEKKNKNHSQENNQGIYEIYEIIISEEPQPSQNSDSFEIIIYENPPLENGKKQSSKKKVEEQKQTSTAQNEKKQTPIVKMLPSFTQEIRKTNQYGESIYTEKSNNKQKVKDLTNQKKHKEPKKQQVVVIDDEDDDKKHKSEKVIKTRKIVMDNSDDELEQNSIININEPNIPKKVNRLNSQNNKLEKINQYITYEYKLLQSLNEEQQPQQNEIHPLFRIQDNIQNNDHIKKHNSQEQSQINQVQQVNLVPNMQIQKDNYKPENFQSVAPFQQDKNYQWNNRINQQHYNSFTQNNNRMGQNFQNIQDQNDGYKYKNDQLIQRVEKQQTQYIQQVQWGQLDQQSKQVQQIQQIHQVQQAQQVKQVQQAQQAQQSQQIQQAEQIQDKQKPQEKQQIHDKQQIQGNQQIQQKDIHPLFQRAQITNNQQILNKINESKINPIKNNHTELNKIQNINQEPDILNCKDKEDNQHLFNCIDQVALRITNQVKEQNQSTVLEKNILNKDYQTNTQANIGETQSDPIYSAIQDVPKQQNNPHPLFMKINQSSKNESVKSVQQSHIIHPLFQNAQSKIEILTQNPSLIASQDKQISESDSQQIVEENQKQTNFIQVNEEINEHRIDDLIIESPQEEEKKKQLPIIRKNFEKPVEVDKPLIINPQQKTTIGFIKMIAFPEKDDLEDIEIPISEENINKQQKLSLFNIEKKLEQIFLSKSMNNKSQLTFVPYAANCIIIQKIYKTIRIAYTNDSIYIKIKIKIKKKSFMNLDSQIVNIEENTLKILRLQIEINFFKERVKHYKQLLLNYKPSDLKQEDIKKNDNEQRQNKKTQKLEQSKKIPEKKQSNKKYECNKCKKQYKTNNALLKHQLKVPHNHGMNQFIKK